jgi:hypothetical protein
MYSAGSPCQLRTTDGVAPESADLVTGLGVDYNVGAGARLAAGHVGIVHVQDRIWVVRSTDTDELSLVDAIDRDSLS